MIPPQNFISRLAPLLAAVFLCFPHTVSALPSGEIYAWVAQEMEVPTEQTLPEVRYVAKEGLVDAFRDNSHNSYLRWKAKYGAARAEEIMKTYMAGVVGVFNATTSVIYVGDFLESCRQQAILAHEFAHYFQLATQGQVDPNGPAAELEQFMREMDALSIERRFSRRYCRVLVP